jgi:multiple sugar transport system ATP-binding protein
VPRVHSTLQLDLDVVEPMGNETYLYGSAADEELVARVAAQEIPSPGRSLEVALDVAKLHFFRKDTGERID